VDLAVSWRYVAPVTLDSASSNPVLAQPYDQINARLAARSYFDLSLTWRVDRRLTLRAGASNILDRDPPLVGFSGVFGNGNTYPGLYDVLGRNLFVGLTARL
jgi:iron complex outermembrane receptor protein